MIYQLSSGYEEGGETRYLGHEKTFTLEEYRVFVHEAALVIALRDLSEHLDMYKGEPWAPKIWFDLDKVADYMISNLGFTNADPVPHQHIGIYSMMDFVEADERDRGRSTESELLHDFIHPKTFDVYPQEQRDADDIKRKEYYANQSKEEYTPGPIDAELLKAFGVEDE